MQRDRYSGDRAIEIVGETKTLTVQDNLAVISDLSAGKVEATDSSKTSSFAGNVDVDGSLNVSGEFSTTSPSDFSGPINFNDSVLFGENSKIFFNTKAITISSSDYEVEDSDYLIFIKSTSTSGSNIVLPKYPKDGRQLIIRNDSLHTYFINLNSDSSPAPHLGDSFGFKLPSGSVAHPNGQISPCQTICISSIRYTTFSPTTQHYYYIITSIY